MRKFLLTLGGLLTASVAFSFAQAKSVEGAPAPESDRRDRLLVIYDSSNSMWGELADTSRKYEAGRQALSNFLAVDLKGRSIGFRAYGHRRKSDCRDSELVVPFSRSDAAKEAIDATVGALTPTGKTPITFSLQEGLKDFGGERGDILLISDGIESCDADPCALMREWRRSNVDIRVHVVGVGLSDMERAAMVCIADVSGGTYFDADTAEGFETALRDAGRAVETPGDPEPADAARTFALTINAADDEGRAYLATGPIFKDGEPVGDASTHKRNVLEGPGDYEVEIGPVLQDGTRYEPVRKAFTVEEFETVVDVRVQRPAIVSATFIEDGEERRGALIDAYQNGERVFTMRPSDEILARPGAYDFRSAPNTDNELTVSETLQAGARTELVFNLTATIDFFVRFVLPNGETIRRPSALWRDGERVYSVFGSNNPTTIVPGVYEIRSDDPKLPLTPVDIELVQDGKTYDVPIEAGWITIRYVPSDFNYVRRPTSAFIDSIDRENSTYARVDVAIPVKPGSYRVNPRTEQGFMEPVDVVVENNQSVDVAFTPKPVGEIVVAFAPSDHWTAEPDRAFVTALEVQRIIKGYMTPGRARKFLPGKYRIAGGGAGGADAVDREIVVKAGETTAVTLTHQRDD